ncbi:MAG TPA: regulatory protein RecX [Chitinophagales bacterium]|nr:regulatory protein RecX [Chitinophagales bacterium]
MQQKLLSQEQIIKKLESYCAYRERCESEVKQKLVALKVEAGEVDFYLQYLIENNLLNENRFIDAYTRGKFNSKSWGRRKIAAALQQKKIDVNKIKQSIEHIDEDMYFQRLKRVLEKKNQQLINEPNENKVKQKLIYFATQKGYEPDLIFKVIKTIHKNE